MSRLRWNYPKTPVPVVNNPICSKIPSPNISWFLSVHGRGRTNHYGEMLPSHDFVWIQSGILCWKLIPWNPCQIIRRINVYESRLKRTWHHSKSAVEEVSFFRRLRVLLLQLCINTWWSSLHDGLGYHAPVFSTCDRLECGVFFPPSLSWPDSEMKSSRSVSLFALIMTSSNGNIFRVTGPLSVEFTGHRWIPLTKASDAELWCFPWSAPE